MMRFEDGSLIPNFDGNICELRDLVESGKKISAETIADNDVFKELFLVKTWGKVCCDGIFSGNYITESFLAEDFLRCPTDEIENSLNYEAFKRIFGEWVTDSHNNHQLICPYEIWESILNDVEGNVTRNSFMMKSRILWICSMTATVPEKLFSEGSGWKFSFVEKREISRLDLTGDAEYHINCAESAKYPFDYKLINNTSENTIHLRIVLNDKDVSIAVPPRDGLRSVFDSLGNIVSIKGRISKIGKNTLMYCHIVSNEIKVKLWDDRYDMYEYKFPGTIFDAAPDGNGGIFILSESGIDSSKREVPNYKVPIQIYGTRTDWAWLYEDGKLQCSNGILYENIFAIVESGPRIVFWDGNGPHTYRNGFVMDISPDEFFSYAFDRFSADDGTIEIVRNTTATYYVNERGYPFKLNKTVNTGVAHHYGTYGSDNSFEKHINRTYDINFRLQNFLQNFLENQLK